MNGKLTLWVPSKTVEGAMEEVTDNKVFNELKRRFEAGELAGMTPEEIEADAEDYLYLGYEL